MTSEKDYAEAHARFEQNLAKAEAQYAAEGRDRETGMTAGQSHVSQKIAPEINQELLAKVTERQTFVDPKTGKRPYVEDEDYRRETEAMRLKAFGAEAPAPPQQQPGQPPADGPVTPESYGEQLAARFDAGDVVTADEVPAGVWRQTLCSGYDVKLPAGYGLSAEHVDMLAAARARGMSQADVSAYVAEMLKKGG